MISDLQYPLIPFDALEGSVEKLTFKTLISSSDNNLGEYRVSKSDNPVRSFDYKFATYKKHMKLFDSLQSDSEAVLIPWLNDFVVESTGLQYINPTFETEVGCIYLDSETDELYCVVALQFDMSDDDTQNFQEKIVFDKDLPAGTLTLVEVVPCQQISDPTIQYDHDIASVSVNLQSLNVYEFGDYVSQDKLLGFDVISFDMLKDPNFNSFQAIRESEQYDNGLTPMVQRFQWSKQFKLVNISFYMDSSDSIDNIKNLFCYLKGQLKSFWMPYYLNNFKLKGVNGSTVQIESIKQSSTLKAVMIVYADKSISYNVVDSYTSNTLVISTKLNKPISKIYELLFGRLNSDELELVYTTNQLATCSIPFMEISYV